MRWSAADARQFPSPQVGSGLHRWALALALCIGFPSPQVGSGLSHPNIVRIYDCVSIPSSRVGTVRFVAAANPVGEFPSPQVGSGPENSNSCDSWKICFHPLKSGRDGRFLTNALEGLSQFPSPQVGSGPLHHSSRLAGACKFTSPQVGSGLSPIVSKKSRRLCFHPLKSGRDLK